MVTKKKTGENISDLVLEIRRRSLAKEQIAQLLQAIAKKCKEDDEETVYLPVSIFVHKKLGSFECAVKFLRDNKKLSITEIAKAFGRKNTAISATYYAANKKDSSNIIAIRTPYEISAKIFKNKKLSVLENLVVGLKKKYSLKNSQIAKLLHRDDRTIWTVIDRAEKRGGQV